MILLITPFVLAKPKGVYNWCSGSAISGSVRHLIIKTNKAGGTVNLAVDPCARGSVRVNFNLPASILRVAYIIDGGTERKSIYMAVLLNCADKWVRLRWPSSPPSE